MGLTALSEVFQKGAVSVPLFHDTTQNLGPHKNPRQTVGLFGKKGRRALN